MPRAAAGRWHRCVTVPTGCPSQEASLLSRTSAIVGALVGDGCHALPGRSRMRSLPARRLAMQRRTADGMALLNLGRKGQQRLLAQRLADDLQTPPQSLRIEPAGDRGNRKTAETQHERGRDPVDV